MKSLLYERVFRTMGEKKRKKKRGKGMWYCLLMMSSCRNVSHSTNDINNIFTRVNMIVGESLLVRRSNGDGEDIFFLDNVGSKQCTEHVFVSLVVTSAEDELSSGVESENTLHDLSLVDIDRANFQVLLSNQNFNR